MCNFDVPIQGAYYATQLLLAEQEGRITTVPYDSNTQYTQLGTWEWMIQ